MMPKYLLRQRSSLLCALALRIANRLNACVMEGMEKIKHVSQKKIIAKKDRGSRIKVSADATAFGQHQPMVCGPFFTK